MTIDDAYAELGLSPDVSLTQAKAAWRSLVSRWHPDRNRQVDAAARMQRINRALEQIRDATQGLAEAEPEAEADPDSFPLRTVQRRVKLTLEEAAAGCIKVLRGTVVDPCGTCAGTGHALKPQDCAACAGQGKVRERVWFGWYGPATACADCEGRGVLRPTCQACEGTGKTEAARYRFSVRLPPGVRDGDLLHVAPPRGAAVALDIQIGLRPHAGLVLDDDGTLRCELPVDGFCWIANRTVDMPTLQGPQPLSLRRGQVVYRLPGKGFPARRGVSRADQIVMVVPRFPMQLSGEQKRLLDRLVATTAAKREAQRTR